MSKLMNLIIFFFYIFLNVDIYTQKQDINFSNVYFNKNDKKKCYHLPEINKINDQGIIHLQKTIKTYFSFIILHIYIPYQFDGKKILIDEKKIKSNFETSREVFISYKWDQKEASTVQTSFSLEEGTEVEVYIRGVITYSIGFFIKLYIPIEKIEYYKFNY